MRQNDKYLVVADPCDGCVKLRDDTNKGIQATRHPKLASIPIAEDGSAWRCNGCNLLWLVDPKEKLWVQAALCTENAVFSKKGDREDEGLSLIPAQILKHPLTLATAGASLTAGFLMGKFGHNLKGKLQLGWSAASQYILPMLPAPARAMLEHNPIAVELIENLLSKQVDIVTSPDHAQNPQLAQYPYPPPGYPYPPQGYPPAGYPPAGYPQNPPPPNQPAPQAPTAPSAPVQPPVVQPAQQQAAPNTYYGPHYGYYPPPAQPVQAPPAPAPAPNIVVEATPVPPPAAPAPAPVAPAPEPSK